MDRNSAFFQRSVKVAASFVQTALVIDDRIFRHRREEPPAAAQGPLTLSTTEPTESGAAVRQQAVQADGSGELSANDAEADVAHDIDAEAVIGGFARNGVVCSVMSHRVEDSLRDHRGGFPKLAHVVDILVVDWNIEIEGRESTDATIELLKSIVQAALDDAPMQLRLVAVYTGEKSLVEVAESIKHSIEGLVNEDSPYAFTKGSLRIVVFGKPVSGRTADDQRQQVEFAALGARSIEEFTMMTAGLLSNVALDAFARLRRSTHRVINRFSGSLDAAFLAHRSLSAPPGDADEQLIPTLVSEMESVLEDTDESHPLCEESIGEWLDTRPYIHPVPHAGPILDTSAKVRAAAGDICTKGVSRHADYEIRSQPEWIKQIKDSPSLIENLTHLIGATPPRDAQDRFELLLSMRRHYGAEPPSLGLGTILALDEGPRAEQRLWICVQPSCDCLIRGCNRTRAFPFLPLSRCGSGAMNLIADDSGAPIRLKWRPSLHSIQHFTFQRDERSLRVVGARNDNIVSFVSQNPEKAFRWICQLRHPQAQRILQQLASDAGSIGLTESEWLRRHAT